MSKTKKILQYGYEHRLDVLVAVHVMGWKWFHINHGGRDFYLARPPDNKDYIRWNFFLGNPELGLEGEIEVAEPDWTKICHDFYNGGGIRMANYRHQAPFGGRMPTFSSNWEAAKLLAERLGRHGQVRHDVFINYEPVCKNWCVSLARQDKDGNIKRGKDGRFMHVEVTDEEMPMALTLAALKLKGVEINEWVMAGKLEKY